MPQPLTNEALDLLLDDQNDLVIVNGAFQFARGIDGVAQLCRIAVQMVAGEWFLNLDAGIPYWTTILGYKPDIAVRAARVAFYSELLSVTGVLSVPKLDVTYDGATRTLSVSWKVRTGFGDTEPDTLAFNITESGSL